MCTDRKAMLQSEEGQCDLFPVIFVKSKWSLIL